MQSLILALHLLSIFFLSLDPSHAASLVNRHGHGRPCSQDDRVALHFIKASIAEDTSNTLSSWTGPHCCTNWMGVRCNLTTGRVVALKLHCSDDQYMSGTLSPALRRLQSLEVLELVGLKRLEGTIPGTLSQLTNLKHLVLDDNNLEGVIPSSLHRLPLRKLSLSRNRLGGPLPRALGSLKSLRDLNLSHNAFTGPIPSTFRDLGNLASLDLSHNSLSGSIPSFVDQLQKLRKLDLSSNKLTGQVPGQISRLVSLITVSLGDNLLTGPIPRSLARLKNLESLDLSSNQLSGSLPSSFRKGLPTLKAINASYNKLSLGQIPSWILNRKLRDVALAGCNVTGLLPEFANPSLLTSVDLSHNHLTGQLDKFVSGMTSLESIKLSNNKLRGDITELVLPGSLISLDLHSNNLRGKVSALLQKASQGLQVLDLSHNGIKGTLPEFKENSSLRVLNLSTNRIAGQIPRSISNLGELEKLDLSKNNFNGIIPSSLGFVPTLQWLDLSNNRFLGPIPRKFAALKKLQHANFSNNRLCGRIPGGGFFGELSAKEFANNLCLCGQPLKPCVFGTK